MKRTSILIAAVGAAALVLAGCSSNDSESGSASSSTQSSAKSTTKAAPLDMSQFEQLPAVPAPAGATVDCTYAPQRAQQRRLTRLLPPASPPKAP